MIEHLKPYHHYQVTDLAWAPRLPSHWTIKRGKAVLAESMLPATANQEIVTCFRDGQVTLRRNRRTSGFMIALYEQGYQGVRKGQLVVHAMDAFAGAIGVSDSDGKCTPEYVVCDARGPSVHLPYVAQALRVAARDGFILASCPSVRERAPRFRWAHLGNFLMPVPPPEEQAAIVRFLAHADRRVAQFIRAKRKLIALLNEQKQAIVHRAVTRGLDPNVTLKDSGVPWLGQIPAHWRLLRSKYLFREVDNRSPRGEETHLSMSQKHGLVPSSSLTERRFMSVSYAGGKLCEAGDLVLNRLKAHLGVFALAPQAGVISPDYTVLRPTAAMAPKYFEAVYRTPACRVVLRQKAKGIVQGFWRLYTDDFYDIVVPVPPTDEQDMIVDGLAQELVGVQMALAQAEREIALMSEYRTRLVTDVVTGQFDVRSAAASLPVHEPEIASAEPTSDEADIDDNEAA